MHVLALHLPRLLIVVQYALSRLFFLPLIFFFSHYASIMIVLSERCSIQGMCEHRVQTKYADKNELECQISTSIFGNV